MKYFILFVSYCVIYPIPTCGYFAFSVTAPDDLGTLYKKIKSKEPDPRVHSTMDDATKKFVCHSIIRSAHFHEQDVDHVEMADIYHELNSYAREEKMNNRPYKHLKKILVDYYGEGVYRKSFTYRSSEIRFSTFWGAIDELAFPCVTKSRTREEFDVLYISDPYDINKALDVPITEMPIKALFICQDTSSSCHVRALAEESAKTFEKPNYLIENIYLSMRYSYRAAQASKDDPICGLSKSEQLRVCSSVISSAYFSDKTQFLMAPEVPECELKEVSFHRREVELKKKEAYNEWMLPCPVRIVQSEAQFVYYVSRAYHSQHAFVYSRHSTTGALYLENISSRISVILERNLIVAEDFTNQHPPDNLIDLLKTEIQEEEHQNQDKLFAVTSPASDLYIKIKLRVRYPALDPSADFESRKRICQSIMKNTYFDRRNEDPVDMDEIYNNLKNGVADLSENISGNELETTTDKISKYCGPSMFARKRVTLLQTLLEDYNNMTFTYRKRTVTFISSTGTADEPAFACLTRVRGTQKYRTYYISGPYNVATVSDIPMQSQGMDTRFLCRMATFPTCTVKAIAEEAATVYPRSGYSVEEIYLELRNFYMVARTVAEDPLCKLGKYEKLRACASVMNSFDFVGKIKFFPGLESVNIECELKKVSFQTTEGKTLARSDIFEYKEWMISCSVEPIVEGIPSIYFVSRAYHSRYAFVYYYEDPLMEELFIHNINGNVNVLLEGQGIIRMKYEGLPFPNFNDLLENSRKFRHVSTNVLNIQETNDKPPDSGDAPTLGTLYHTGNNFINTSLDEEPTMS